MPLTSSASEDQDGEDDQVDDALGVLLVVHRADAGDEAEQRGEAGVGLAGDRRWHYAGWIARVAPERTRSRRRRPVPDARGVGRARRRWRADVADAFLQSGLPQFWQKAARSRSGWFAQFIPVPLLFARCRGSCCPIAVA
jgi:hypothetical protein